MLIAETMCHVKTHALFWHHYRQYLIAVCQKISPVWHRLESVFLLRMMGHQLPHLRATFLIAFHNTLRATLLSHIFLCKPELSVSPSLSFLALCDRKNSKICASTSCHLIIHHVFFSPFFCDRIKTIVQLVHSGGTYKGRILYFLYARLE